MSCVQILTLLKETSPYGVSLPDSFTAWVTMMHQRSEDTQITNMYIIKHSPSHFSFILFLLSLHSFPSFPFLVFLFSVLWSLPSQVPTNFLVFYCYYFFLSFHLFCLTSFSFHTMKLSLGDAPWGKFHGVQPLISAFSSLFFSALYTVLLLEFLVGVLTHSLSDTAIKSF